MFLPVIPFPAIDPILIEFGPVAIRWYGLAYVAALLLGWRYIIRLAARPETPVEPRAADDFLIWAMIGVVLGGRLGHVLFYQPAAYFADPAQILRIWQGGMSFHGGMLGVAIAIVLFARRRHLPVLAIADLVAAAAPIGQFFGRLANFINGELYGRVSDVPWAMVFPAGGPLPRHPSQLYQAGIEGLALFIVLALLVRGGALAKPGTLTGAFLLGYGLARIFAEFFRAPDAYLGFLIGGATMGQLLSLPMLAVGGGLIWWARRQGDAMR